MINPYPYTQNFDGTTSEKIEYIKDGISQALFFLEHQSTSFPVEATIQRAKELRALQNELGILECDLHAEYLQYRSEAEFV